MNKHTGKSRNIEWNIGAKHALLREDGKWYHLLEMFPGALIDANGYLLFQTEGEYLECKYLSIGKEINIPGGISHVPGYRLVIREDFLPEELSTTISYSEGSKLQITVNSYERNPQARKICINYHGTTCIACGFNFEEAYGDVGHGVIHVHHIIPLSTIKENYAVDPIHDLVPICPNCHAIIHRREPPYSIDEVKKMIHDGNKE